MKRFLLLIFALLIFYLGYPQTELLVQSNDKGLYLVHTVNPKENFYSIGRMYHIPPKEIEAFNSLNMNDGLHVGQTLLIPLTDANFSQTDEQGTPVYYVVEDKEGLYRVSVKNNKVPLDNLRKWNQITGDAIASGQKLVIGYLNAGEATAGTAVPAPQIPTRETSPVPNPPVKEPQPPPAEQKNPEPVAATKQPEEIKKAPVPASVPPPPASSSASGAPGSGYFKSQFDQQTARVPASKEETATASIFKTASGWQDGKYYALMDGVEPGTIIKVINPGNNKAVYAKVLGEMSGIRQNKGLEVRISNAAASVLEVTDTEKFIVQVNY